jgi:hypothetical protein
VEERARDLRHVREDVTGAGGVLAALETRSELAVRVEHVDVVAADKVLREADNRALQRGVAVVVRRVLRDVTGKLSDLRRRESMVSLAVAVTAARRGRTLISFLSLRLKQPKRTLR